MGTIKTAMAIDAIIPAPNEFAQTPRPTTSDETAVACGCWTATSMCAVTAAATAMVARPAAEPHTAQAILARSALLRLPAAAPTLAAIAVRRRPEATICHMAVHVIDRSAAAIIAATPTTRDRAHTARAKRPRQNRVNMP